MSVTVMSEVWKLDLRSNLKFTLLAFADHADDDGRCFPSKARIAWKCGVTPRTVQRHIQELKRRDLLQVVEHATPNSTPTYVVQPSRGDNLSPLFGAGGQQEQSGGTETADRGDTGVSQTISNRQGNHHSAREGSHTREGQEQSMKNGRSLDDHLPEATPEMRQYIQELYGGDE